jgi:hypothetical protein
VQRARWVVQWYWKHGLLHLRWYLGITPHELFFNKPTFNADIGKWNLASVTTMYGPITMAEVAGGLRAWAELPLVPELSTTERQEIRACTARILNALMRKWSRAIENLERREPAQQREHRESALTAFAIDYLSLRGSAAISASESQVPPLSDVHNGAHFLRAQASMNTANAAVPLCFGRSEMSALAEHVLLLSVRR